ncbi:alpha/beta-hydrolase [Dendrothele bispora CBS 962.96]|uniref:Alpha/beta-hydrolase n=1 Tax=Dendrothele bispora (strain CBS 962.96) TaxID=1314807 RepID=A0A4S8MF51_DENBC|nr:alpha/beta-hydrolase [Dendrothele bispora CBS 962.96]
MATTTTTLGRLSKLLLLTALYSSLSLVISVSAEHEHVYSGFNPRAYDKRTVRCKAVKRDEGNKVVDIDLTYVDINPTAPQTLLMVHGWPSLWSSWAYQIQEFKDDYHLVIPDLRGFGDSGHPGDVKSSGTLYDIVGDLDCILDDVGVKKGVVCVGHDWGAAVCYEAGRSRPDIFSGVIGGVVPYIPSSSPTFTPTSSLVPFLPKLAYQLYFDSNTSLAIAELNKDKRKSLRSTLRMKESPVPDTFLTSKENYLRAWDDWLKEQGKEEEGIPAIPFLSREEEDYFVESYERSGFDYTLQFYTTENREASWKFAHDQGNFTLPQPVLAILPLEDPVADWQVASKILGSEQFLPRLTTEMLPGEHWVQLDHPDLFNEKMRKWLEVYFPPGIADAPPAEEKEGHDEL